jgi:hypothetical protein
MSSSARQPKTLERIRSEARICVFYSGNEAIVLSEI